MLIDGLREGGHKKDHQKGAAAPIHLILVFLVFYQIILSQSLPARTNTKHALGRGKNNAKTDCTGAKGMVFDNFNAHEMHIKNGFSVKYRSQPR